MKAILKLILLVVLTTTLSALEPMKVAFVYTAGTPTSVRVQMADNTSSSLFVGENLTSNITPSSSGIVIVNVQDHAGSGTTWSDYNASNITTYHTLDIYVNGTLYAQYRLDALILAQAQASVFDNDGNFNPTQEGASLGTDGNRWSELFVEGNTIHIGPALGAGAGDELSFSYDDATNTATMTVAGVDEMTVNSDAAVITGGIIGNPSSADKDFIFGDDDLTYNSGFETKMFFDKSEGAFRVGSVNSTNWENSNIGSNSVAMGNNTTASGYTSLAIGENTTASNDYSSAFGFSTTASGQYATALGDQTNATGTISTALGSETISSGNISLATGSNTIASGVVSTAMGNNTSASGFASTAIGESTIADANSSLAIGIFNDNTITGELLTIGNGTSNVARSNAFEVYSNGDVVIPTLGGSGTQNIQVDNTGKIITGGGSPFTHDAANNKVYRNDPDDDFIFGDDDFNHSSGSEMKMFFDKSKGSFRAGTVTGTAWDDANIGNNSFALGINTTASGNNSVAMGVGAVANNANSIAFGGSTASGINSLATGVATTASGNYSTAMGVGTRADESESTSLGMYNDETITGEIFTIGNGTNSSTRSNALEVYKNGDVIVPALAGGGTQNIQVDNDGKIITGGGGGSSEVYTEVNSNTTLTTNNQVVYISGNYTVTLPDPPATGQTIKIISDDVNATLDPQTKVIRDRGTDYSGTSDLFDFGGANQYQLTLYYNGTKWLPISK